MSQNQETQVVRPNEYIGARVQRVEDPKYLRGDGQYVDDVEIPGMLHAAFVRSPFPHARIKNIETSGALNIPGVLAVFTGKDLEEDTGEITTAVNRPEVRTASRRALPLDKARHVGDPVAVVVAKTRYSAEDGVDAIEVDWEPLPAISDPEESLLTSAVRVDEALEDNNIAHIEGGAGDVDLAFSEAKHIFKKRFVAGRTAGAPLEPRGVVAKYESSSNRLTVWCSSQCPHLLRTFLAPILKINEGMISVVAPDVGGGFGQKSHLFPEDVVIPAISMKLGKPVKWISDRYEDLSASIHSKGMVCEIEISLDEEHNFTGIRGHFISDSGAYSSMPFSPLVDALLAGTQLPSMYKVENVKYIVDTPLTNKCHIGAIRGVGWVPGQMARESLIDDIARELKVDPIELRLKNVLESVQQVTVLGCKIDSGSYSESIQSAARQLDYDQFRTEQKEQRQSGRYLGIGFSPFIEPCGLGTDMCHQNGMPASFHDRASVTMEPDGSVTVTTGLHSHGQGHQTTLAQVAADKLGVRLENVRVVYGTTEGSVYGMGTYASRSAVIGTGAIRLAAEDIKEKLLAMAGQLLEASPDDIELYDGEARLKGAPVKSMPISELAGFSYFGGRARPESIEEYSLASTRSYDPPETYSNGCCGVIVEVDTATGNIKLLRVAAVEDCGLMLNPTIVEGQISGAIVQGIGAALLEDAAYDEDGQFQAGSLMDYLYPTATEIPDLEIVHIETPSPVTAEGVKGMGEAGTIASPAAVINAVADALEPFGVQIGKSPLTPSYILELLREKASPSS